MADFGADVIKVEGPAGDIIRSNGVSRSKGMGSIYLSLNRNKRSVVLDLKSEQGKEALRELIRTADVVVHNMRMKAIERLGFGYEARSEEHTSELQSLMRSSNAVFCLKKKKK